MEAVSRAALERTRPWDIWGGILLLANIAWTLVAAAVAGGSPWPVAWWLALLGGVWLAAGAVAARLPTLVPFAVTAVVAVLLLIGVAGTLASEGSWVAVATYPNAAGALALQGALAAGMLAVLGASRLRRMVSAAVALAFAFSGVLSGSVAASVLIGACALVLAISGTARATRVLATVAVVGFLAAFLTTIVLGRLYSPASASSGAERRAADALSSRRLSLWHNALEMMTERPAFGIGPGRFQFEHRPAARDRDARWAHDEFLQRGAETGVFGLLLGVALLVWALLRLGWASPNHPIAVIGIAAVGALAVHACVDHVLHDPVLPAVAAALGGFAARTGDRRGAALTSTRLGWGRA